MRRLVVLAAGWIMVIPIVYFLGDARAPLALVGFFLYAMRSVMQAWAIEAAPNNLAGSAIGLQFGMQAIGSSISPALFGMIADAHGIYAAFYFLAGSIIAVIVSGGEFDTDDQSTVEDALHAQDVEKFDRAAFGDLHPFCELDQFDLVFAVLQEAQDTAHVVDLVSSAV